MRYLYFKIRFNQWFQNTEGIKEFAEQVIGWLMKSVLNVAAKLKMKNKQLFEKIKELRTLLIKKIQYPVIDADEFAEIRKKIRTYTIIIAICLIGETFFNYFAANAIFTFKGWAAIIAKIVVALLITWGAFTLFESLFYQILFEKPYKSDYKEKRNVLKLITLSIMAVCYETLIYYLCRMRGMQIEGTTGDGLITTAMMLVGMLMPVIAGYFTYEKSRFYSPYKNTIEIEKLNRTIASCENRIKTNQELMENHFNRGCQENWAVLQEFKTYKENFNLKRDYPVENLSGHFCELQGNFKNEAITRYKQQMIDEEEKVLSINSGNGKADTVIELFKE